MSYITGTGLKSIQAPTDQRGWNVPESTPTSDCCLILSPSASCRDGEKGLEDMLCLPFVLIGNSIAGSVVSSSWQSPIRVNPTRGHCIPWSWSSTPGPDVRPAGAHYP